MAVIAVLSDHAAGTIYHGYNIYNIWLIFRFSVPLFILISGYLNYISNKRHNYPYLKYVIHSCKKIIVAYIIATIVYSVVYTHSINIYVLKDFLLHFSASGPFYYVSIYVQLMLIGNVIYRMLEANNNKWSILRESIMMIIIIILGVTFTNHAHIPGIEGKPGILFGGTYLIVFFGGMLLSKHEVLPNSENMRLLLVYTLISSIVFVLWWRLICIYGIDINNMANIGVEQGIGTVYGTVAAMCVLLFSWGFFQLCSRYRRSKYITAIVGWIGKHSLYIYMYHLLWHEYLLKKYVIMDYGIVKTLIYLSGMILLSVLMEIVITKLSLIIRKAFTAILNNRITLIDQ